MTENKKNTRTLWCAAGFLWILFFALILAVKFVDPAPIGPMDSVIGLSALNAAVRDFIGENKLWYDITDWLGFAAIAVAFGFALLGVYEVFRRKSLKKVDIDLILLGVFYAAVIGVYVFFEIFVVNYRPILIENELEAAFPSSHTMLVVCIMGSAIVQFVNRLPKGMVRILAVIGCALVLAVTVVGRMLSGVHWLTDILGGVLISSALITTYIAGCQTIKNK